MIVSIIVPVFNGVSYIPRLMDFLTSELCEHWEVVLVDDHSTDESWRVMTEYANNHRNIRCVVSEGKGVTYARKTGALKATGKYLFFLDVDDLLPKGIIKILNDIVINNNYDLIIGDIIEEVQSGSEIVAYGRDNNHQQLFNDKDLFNWICSNECGYLWAKLIRTDLFLNLKYWPYNVKILEDYIQMLQISYNATNVYHISQPIYIYKFNPNSACHRHKTKDELASEFFNFAKGISELTKCFGFQEPYRSKVLSSFVHYVKILVLIKFGWHNIDYKLRVEYRNSIKEISKNLDLPYSKKIELKIIDYFPYIHSLTYQYLMGHKYKIWT